MVDSEERSYPRVSIMGILNVKGRRGRERSRELTSAKNSN